MIVVPISCRCSRAARLAVVLGLLGHWSLGCDGSSVPVASAEAPMPAASVASASASKSAASDPAAPDPALPAPVAAPDKMPHFAKQGPVQTTLEGPGEGPYRFTADWHVKHIPTWTTVFADHMGKPGLRYLEIGVYEGRSLLWMAHNVLTDPSCELLAVDVFAGDYEQAFDHNVQASGRADRITKLKGPSGRVLRDPSLGTFDIIYVDGSHTADDVLADAVLAWGLLAPGGVLVFDDYGWTGRQGTPLPPELLPRMAIDLFLAAYRYEVEMVHVGYQIAVRRVANPCQPKDYCSPIGQYAYYWRDYELRRADGSVVELTDAERGLVEALGRSRPIGSFEPQIPPAVRRAPAWQALVRRLELAL